MLNCVCHGLAGGQQYVVHLGRLKSQALKPVPQLVAEGRDVFRRGSKVDGKGAAANPINRWHLAGHRSEHSHLSGRLILRGRGRSTPNTAKEVCLVAGGCTR